MTKPPRQRAAKAKKLLTPFEREVKRVEQRRDRIQKEIDVEQRRFEGKKAKLTLRLNAASEVLKKLKSI